MKVCIIGGGGQIADSVGSLLAMRGIDVSFYRPREFLVAGIPSRPKRPNWRLKEFFVSFLNEQRGGVMNYRWATNDELLRKDVFIFAAPSFLVERIAKELAPFLVGKIFINLSDRFLGTYAVGIEVEKKMHSSIGIGIALSSPPILAYQSNRVSPTKTFYKKKNFFMACFPRTKISTAQNIFCELFGFGEDEIHTLNSVFDLAFENINSILHAVQDLENLKRRKYFFEAPLYCADTYNSDMVERINEISKERNLIAQYFVGYSPRPLEVYDNSVFFEKTNINFGGSPSFRIEHSILKEIPRPRWYSAHGYEDVGWSIVPLESFGRAGHLSTPNVSRLINEWNSFMKVDYRSIGRTIESLELIEEGAVVDSRLLHWKFDAF